ncbi:MAG: SDR family NAD(P)-dependent oxidoreductase, partial [Syntrophobacteraceae bacterium]|nr:SDR family NAD(P)-dependent oxidoreductase [Syntrophobacteraceae bacterium]
MEGKRRRSSREGGPVSPGTFRLRPQGSSGGHQPLPGTMLRRVQTAFGPVDFLINSAGAARRSLPEDVNVAAWHAAMDAKYFSYVHPLDLVIKRMAARGHGAIVNIIGAGGKVANPVHLP